jgi:CheY-like chemotaxis protein
MAVKLYTLEDLRAVHGLYADKAMAKVGGDFEVYCTFLDKFLNQMPRTIPRLKNLLKKEDMREYAEELKALRIDLADIYALDLYERANILFDAAVNGETEKCQLQLDPFIRSLQDFAYEVKQCRTKEDLENASDAASKAAEMDIGTSVVNNKYSTVNKAKFIDLFNRMNDGLFDKALNLANVLKSMGYDGEITGRLEHIISDLNNNRTKQALKMSVSLLVLLGCPAPEIKASKFKVLLVDASIFTEQIRFLLKDEYMFEAAKSATEAVACVKSSSAPDFILINSGSPGIDAFTVAEQIKKTGAQIPAGFIFAAPTSTDILKARSLGATEFFITPLDERAFLEKLAKYKQ